VADTALGQEEVTSRHPCIGGLRNIVRLSARSAVRNISLPLLLVDGLKEEVSTFMKLPVYSIEDSLPF
jgi:hypothetical protein